MKKLLTWIWCFPQMLVGAIFTKFTKEHLVTYDQQYNKVDEYYVIGNKYGGSVSFGTYIFVCDGHLGNETVLKHELGHTKQSYYLGWLYIPVILLPSMIWAGCFQKYREKHNVSYYSFYTERWADKLAGIER